MNFSEISRYHDCAAAVIEKGLVVHRVKSIAVAAFDEAIRIYAMELRESKIVGPPWEDFLIAMRRVNRTLSESPISPATICGSFQNVMDGLKPQIKIRMPTLTEDLKYALDLVVKAYTAVKAEATNPMAQVAVELLNAATAASKTTLVVHRHMAYNEMVIQALHLETSGTVATLLPPRAVSINQPVDLIVFFGPPIFFEYRGESSLFQAPSAPDLHFIQFDHLTTGQLKSGLLSERKKLHISSSGDSEVLLGNPLESIHIPSPPSFTRKVTPWGGDISYPKGERANIKSVRVVLGGGKGIHLDANGSVYQVIAKKHNDSVECDAVYWTKVEKLELGDAIVVTTDGAGDMIRPYADKILGPIAAEYRQMQNRWKESLQKLVDEEGLHKACKMLRNCGCRRANHGNVRNWMGPFNIAPFDLNIDFANLLKCIGWQDQVRKYVECVEQIRTAHRKAGLKLQFDLLKALKGKPISQLFSQGFLRFRAEQGGPSKTVFLIEAIDPEPCFVSQSAINHVVDLERHDE